jgi:hypothetical protein
MYYTNNMTKTYIQTVEIMRKDRIVDTIILPCPVYPEANEHANPYSFHDKTLKCPDDSVITWTNELILQSFPSGYSYVWWNPFSILRCCVDNPTTKESYYRTHPSGSIEARFEGRFYTWSTLVDEPPVEGDIIPSWWHHCSDGLIYNPKECFTTQDEKRRCLCPPITEDEEEFVSCQGCDNSMSVGDVNQYRSGYWCSRACAFYQFMN